MSTAEREFSFSDKDFRFIVKLVGESTGIVLGDHKRDMVYGRLVKRLRALKIPSFRDYCNLLQSDAGTDEMGNFVNAVTTNLTGIFREPHHFDYVIKQAIPALLKARLRERKIRIWSAGCSTGAEAYSIAVCLHESVKDLASWDIKILATDIDTNVLAAGQKGEYAENMADKMPSALRSKYLLPLDKKKIAIREDLKDLVTFKQLNLLNAWPMKGKFDIIFCRNVVIYFDKPTQATLFNRFADILYPDGWLFIGHSENLHKVCDRFRLIGKTIYKRVS